MSSFLGPLWWYIVTIGILVTFLFMIAGDLIPRAYAAQTTPAQHVYNGRLLNASGQPVTTSMSIRFSYWKSVDEQSTDITGTGAINTSATNYASWQEVHTLTPNANGYFSVNLGDTVALPDMATMPTSTLLSLYLQVEVKPAASAETAYELLDSDSTDTAIDRSGVLSVPFAANADLLDQHEIGTGSGSIPLLTSGGVLPKSVIPSGTNQDTFTLDADNTAATSIVLQFGQTLAKTLSYNIGSGTFVFNASLQVQGNLTVTGLINGLDLATIQSSTGSLKASSGGGLTLRVAGGNYRLNGTSTNYGGGTISLAASTTNYVFFGSGGLTKNTTGFPSDESYIAVAQVVTNTGAVYTISDRRALQSDDREQTKEMVFTPEYDKAGYSGDGSNNVGQLSILYDTGSLKNFYAWTSTKSSLQDYDIVLNIPVPASFTHWRTDGSHHALSIGYRSTSTSSAVTKLDIAVYDSAGQQVTLVGTSTSLSSLTWATTTLNFGGSPVWTAGGNMLVKLKMSAKDTEAMHLGSLKLEYVELAQ